MRSFKYFRSSLLSKLNSYGKKNQHLVKLLQLLKVEIMKKD